MSKIKVVEVIECGGPGGTGNQVAAICNGLDPARFEVTLVYAVRPGAAPEDYRALAKGAAAAVFVPELTREISPLKDWAAFRKLYALFRELRPDVVHAHSSKAGALARPAARLAGVPRVFYTPHGYGFLQQDRGAGSRLLYRLAERALSWIGTVVAVSPSEAEFARPLAWGQPVETVCDPFLGQMPEAAGPAPHEGVVVGSCGRLTYARHPEAFASLAESLRADRPGVRCVWIGGGELESALQGRVDVTGWLEPAEARRRLAGLDVLVHYSRWDGLPNAVLEAMAQGLPVVASDVPGCRDAVAHAETGYLAKDERQLRDFTLKLLDDPSLRKRLGDAGRRRVEREFRLDSALKRLQELYAG